MGPFIFMKKIYEKPLLDIMETEMIQIIAESLIKDDTTTVDGGEALINEDNNWGDGEW